MLYVEVATAVFERKGRMFPATKLEDPEIFGYRSVYMFCEEDAALIRARGESKGFSDFSPFSNCLFVDIDIKTEEEDARAIAQIEALKATGIRFELWNSGNRSYHLHIPHPLKRGFSLPYTHYKVVQALGIDCDESIYRPNSLYRLPNTIHDKTGRRKVLLGSFGSEELDFDLLPEERFITIKPKRRLVTGEDRHMAVISIFRRIVEYLGSLDNSENRFLAMNKLIYPLSPFISFETALEIALLINQGIDDPNEVSEVVRAVRGCYS